MSITYKAQSLDHILIEPEIPSDSALPFSDSHNLHGGILSSSSGDNIYLRQYHTIGRSKDCNTPLSRNDISRIHAVIFWQESRWYIQDKSTNGVWVNSKRIAKDQTIALNKNDQITLSSKSGDILTLVSNDEPSDILMSSTSLPSICLNKPFTKLSKQLSLYFENGIWYIETLAGDSWESTKVYDGDTIHIDDADYTLQANRSEEKTCQNRPVVRTVEDLTFRLNVSNDEEEIQLSINDSEHTATIGGHRLYNQLYLFLCLARQSISDRALGYEPAHCGWVNLNELSNSLGIEPENTRIRLHRLRTRLRDTASFSGIDACQILQLQGGEVRLNTANIQIVKGDKNEH
ncbi:FHA domain-containing protein [Vibrio nigripulchritudo]|uniref:FHA domain-containing protein n=1 Tax=Vibrio nigripulchritudo TaxID=28173 RepID=UPI0005FA72C3|nr:FHA domain-containing protein [Vibrio nigripulchritudo]KJY69770.1 hypothetical protein TW74_24020 [Vibrio nigripulchritudo]